MSERTTGVSRILIFYLILVTVACLPVWAVDYFVNQDGPAHLHSSHLMLELLRGNAGAAALYSFNSLAVPNSSGHWLMAALLPIFSPFTVTKIVVTLTFAGLAAAAGWLRWRTSGPDGVGTAVLYGAVLSFNWLWLAGFYNFMIGVIGFAFTLGLYYGWRGRMGLRRAAVLALLLLLVYFSHLVSFAVLAGSILTVALIEAKNGEKKPLFWTLAAFLPVVPLALVYKSLAAAGGQFSPVWLQLENPLSAADWIAQIRAADPFFIISRRALPFAESTSSYFSLLAPVVWIAAAVLFLSAATARDLRRRRDFLRRNPAFLLLFASSVAAALFLPDHFGTSQGTVLRERILLCGLIFFVPLFRTDSSVRLKRTGQICLLVVFAFQTAALWDYSLATSRDAREYLAAAAAVSDEDEIASITILEKERRFASLPVTQMTGFLGTVQQATVWDNYEMGHHLFPVVLREAEDKQFVLDLTSSNVFERAGMESRDDEQKLAKLEAVLARNHQKIDKIIVWGRDERIEALLSRWYDALPLVETARVRVYRHKQNGFE